MGTCVYAGVVEWALVGKGRLADRVDRFVDRNRPMVIAYTADGKVILYELHGPAKVLREALEEEGLGELAELLEGRDGELSLLVCIEW